MNSYFTQKLLLWHTTQNQRKMPWKEEKDAYKIWLSEIILQQTKVEQGLKYYENFIKEFPTITHLAKAKPEKVFKMWEGLGYYNRCKNLLFTAKEIVQKHNAIFPKIYNEILALKGIGIYTAAAISSFAYNLPYAVVDGNVYRVLSRFLGNATPIDCTEGKKLFAEKAEHYLDTNQSAIYNQAIMDFGATVCKPKLALCTTCPLQKKCVAYQTNSVYTLPIKTKKLVIKQRTFLYFLIEYKNKWLVRKRTESDIWQNLYEFVQQEVAIDFNLTSAKAKKELHKILPNGAFTITALSTMYKQKLSHQTISAYFVKVNWQDATALDSYRWKSKTALQQLPFAAIINDFLQKEKKRFIFNK